MALACGCPRRVRTGLAAALLPLGCSAEAFEPFEPARPQIVSDMGIASDTELLLRRLRATFSKAPGGFTSNDTVVQFEAKGPWLCPRFQRRAPTKVCFGARLHDGILLEDTKSATTIHVVLEDASPTAAEDHLGHVVYRETRASRAVIHRPQLDGTEELIAFERGPAQAAVSYRVSLGEGAFAARLVAQTFEVLDRGGAPRLRMAPPYVIDSAGQVLPARVSVRGCAVSVDSSPPWGRPMAPAGTSCSLRIDWSHLDLSYPLVLDPGWTTTGSMSESRANHAAASISADRVLVSGGDSALAGVVLKTAEVYDALSGTWAAAGAMQSARARHVAVTLPSGKILVSGGRTTTSLNTPTATAELYDPVAGTWSAAATLGEARYDHTATSLSDGRVLVAGGVSTVAYLASAEVYAPSTNSWAAVGPMPVGRHQHAAQQLNDARVLVAGGESSGGTYLATAELFDPVTGQWSATGSLNVGRRALSATLLSDGRVMAIGGYPSPEAVDIYVPSTGAWAKVNDLPSPRHGHTATLLKTGAVLIAGGFVKDETGGGSASVLSYEPWSGAWAPLGAMAFGRALHTATALAGDEVLVAGGQALDPIAAAERFSAGAGPIGAACAAAVECVSGHCVDGVCCNTPCGGLCQACSTAAKGFGDDGLCGSVAAGSDPYDDCPADPGFPASCLADGMCDGQGACRMFAPQATVCGPPACSASQITTLECDGSGTCAGVGKTCAPYTCVDASSCSTACLTSIDCAPTAYCNAGTCAFKWVNEHPCTASQECASGNCVDGVCCDQPCSGQCEACNVSGKKGTCSPVTGDPVAPRVPCAGQGAPCAGTCDGVLPQTCSYPGSATDCGSTCSDDVEIARRCNGAGQCYWTTPQACTPYRCENGGNCATHCVDDSDCAASYRCQDAECISATASCIDERTLLASGQSKDCAPYRCSGDACLESCSSDNDCIAPATCTASNTCKPPDDDGDHEVKGCACRVGGTVESPFGALPRGWAAIVLGLVALRWRFRARRHTG